MAKQAKHPIELDIPDRVITKAVREVLDRYGNIDSAKGTYMSASKVERKAMAEIYQGLAQRGIAQHVAKAEIKVIQLLEKIVKVLDDLEIEDRRMIARMARAQEDTRQLSLFGKDVLPKKSRSKNTKPPADLESTETIGAA